MPKRKHKASCPYVLVGHARPAHRASSLLALLLSQLVCLRRARALLRRLRAKLRRRCGAGAEAGPIGTYCGGSGRSCCGRLAVPGPSVCAWRQAGENPAAGFRRPRRAALSACGAAGATSRCLLASQAGLAAARLAAARPSSALARSLGRHSKVSEKKRAKAP